MPVLFSRRLLYELEARWPSDFETTRRNRLRRGEEIELNFFYHHYLRVMRYPVAPQPSRKIIFEYAQLCAPPRGDAICGRPLRERAADFITFNDDASSREKLDKGLDSLHRMLAARFGAALPESSPSW